MSITTSDKEILQGLARKIAEIAADPVNQEREKIRADMVVRAESVQPLCYTDTGFGISEDVDIEKTDNDNSVVSRHFNIQITDEADIDKIKKPVITKHEDQTEEQFQKRCEIFDGILNVRKCGVQGFWFAPWDDFEKGAANVRDRFIFGWRPNPAFLAPEKFDPDLIRNDITEKLAIAKENGCTVAIYLKDISTVAHDPQRLKQWNNIAKECVS